MSENKHTPEPWAVSVEIFDNDGVPETAIQALNRSATVAVALDFGLNNPSMREANARRIVACVNACAGIPNDMVAHVVAFGRQGYDKTVLELADAKNQLRLKDEKIDHITDALIEIEKQRDELLAALEHFATWARCQHRAQSKGCHATFDMMMLRDEVDFAEAAIASVKELK